MVKQGVICGIVVLELARECILGCKASKWKESPLSYADLFSETSLLMEVEDKSR